jgi:peptidyl-prolyl cis-trans isomerase B (cyclophilin B)
MAARQEAARRRRLVQARIGAGIAGVVVIATVVLIVVASAGGSSQPVANASTGPKTCEWVNQLADLPTPSPGVSPSLPAGIKDVGTPATVVESSGYQVLTFDTNLGVIKVEMDLSKTPCTAASLAFLAGKGFYNNTSCHRLVNDIFALQCGDPSGEGSGGATYRFADENLPVGKLPSYHTGDVAMANTGQEASNGSQFFFLYDNSALDAKYTLWGKVIEGLDIVKKVAAAGDDGAFTGDNQPGGGHPKMKITFNSVTAGPVLGQSQVKPTTPAPATTPSTQASPTATTAVPSP